jgi:hypothetical protein
MNAELSRFYSPQGSFQAGVAFATTQLDVPHNPLKKHGGSEWESNPPTTPKDAVRRF